MGLPIGPDCALHSSFVPHSDLVTWSMNRWFTVNLLGEPIGGVSTTASSISPSFHHVTDGLGLPVDQFRPRFRPLVDSENDYDSPIYTRV